MNYNYSVKSLYYSSLLMKVNFVKEFVEVWTKVEGRGVNILMAIDKKNNHQGVLFMAKVYHNIIIALYD